MKLLQSSSWRVGVLLLTVLGNIGFLSSVRATLTSNLTVEIKGIRNQDGQVCLSLFAGAKGFPTRAGSAVRQQCLEITDTPQLVNFRNLESGSYAVAVLHDTNGDRQANRNVFGIPTEGFGFSRNPTIATGPPKFGKSVVVVAGSSTNIQIQLRYL